MSLYPHQREWAQYAAQFANQQLFRLAAAVRVKYAELFEGSQCSGSIGLDTDLIDVEIEWAKERDDIHYRIAQRDPIRIRWLTTRLVEDYFDYRSAFYRAEQLKGKKTPESAKRDDQD
ncbi:hypothetical protein IC229_34815 [Spirosoma sp. BT702]|uniref:Uncharacterized protein n=1 Tax=Spirosoma profusum TaxID=2771354 RepID=A0A927AWS7_9BACT|nr:hypothetical protein [Spirosoma profusum]MBD2705824.1 hypothetical protein [Spirosoma profusum]